MATEKQSQPFLTTVLSSVSYQNNVFHMLPRPNEITEALLDVIEYNQWTSVGVIYATALGM